MHRFGHYGVVVACDLTGADAGQPDVAVIVPAFDGERHVGAALASIRDSVASSSDIRFEVLVVDAGSSDGTSAVVESIAERDERFRLLRSTVRLTAPQARNLALTEARAPVVACLDHDDLMIAGRLERHLRVLHDEPDLAAVGGSLVHMDGIGVDVVRERTATETPPIDADPPIAGVELSRYVLPVVCPTLTSAMTYRNATLRAVGGFFEHRPYADDYHLFAALFDHGGVRMLAEPAARYRTHGLQLSARSRPEQHLEVVRLRQQIAATVLGETPPIDVVWAWRDPRSARPDTLVRAIEQFDRYHHRFLERFAPDGVELARIDRFHGRLVARMRRELDGS